MDDLTNRMINTALGIIITAVVASIFTYIKNHFFIDASLLWTVNQKDGTTDNETKTLIELRNAGKVSIENYPILVRFTLGTKIYETYYHIIPPEINYCPLEEQEELRKQYRKRWKRAYRVNLAPKDILQLHFKSSGKNGEIPSVWSIGELLDQSQKDIFFAKDNAQSFLRKLSEAYPIPQKLLGAPSRSLSRVLVLILCVSFGTILVQEGWLRGLGVPLELGLLILIGSLIASIGFIVFQLVVWSDSLRIIYSSRPLGISSLVGLLNSLASFTRIIGVILIAFVTVLEYYGQHILLLEFVEFIIGKMVKLVTALTH